MYQNILDTLYQNILDTFEIRDVNFFADFVHCLSNR